MRTEKISGFTIIELLVVMGVIVMITSIGVAGLIMFRQNVQLQVATTDFISLMKSIENRARTNSLTNQVIPGVCSSSSDDPLCRRPDAYALYFDSDSNYSVRYCMEVDFSGSKVYTCAAETLNAKPVSFVDVKIYPDATMIDDCRGIVFERGTGDIVGVGSDSLAAKVNSGTCIIQIGYEGDQVRRTLEIDLVNNSINQTF